MEDNIQVEFIVKQDAIGRIGTISIKDRVYAGWVLLPRQEPVQIQLMQCRVLPSYAPHAGQGQMILRALDLDESAAELEKTNLVGGLIVDTPTPPSIGELIVDIEFETDSIGYWLNSPDVEQRLRQTNPELFELTPSELELNVWYPVELVAATSTSFGYGVFQIINKIQNRQTKALVRYIYFDCAVCPSTILLNRFDRYVGRIIHLYR